MTKLLDITNMYILQFPVSGNNSLHVPDTAMVYVIRKFITWYGKYTPEVFQFGGYYMHHEV
jgi:hypothetical protein